MKWDDNTSMEINGFDLLGWNLWREIGGNGASQGDDNNHETFIDSTLDTLITRSTSKQAFFGIPTATAFRLGLGLHCFVAV